MTPVDIDKLKELLAKATKRPWKATASCEYDHFGLYPDTGKREFPLFLAPDYIKPEVIQANAVLIVAVVNSLPALIAKAERVDALERALEPFAKVANSPVYADEDVGPRFTMETHRAARNALSPKESE